jgi:hypothetical protein
MKLFRNHIKDAGWIKLEREKWALIIKEAKAKLKGP